MTGTQNILEIQGLTKRFKSFTLGPIDLNIPAGCITGFIGENGAGKSTTMNLILGLLRPDAGSIRIFGRENYVNDPEVFEQIGVVLDVSGLHETMTAKETSSVMKSIFRRWDMKGFERLCDQLRVPFKSKIKAMSHGMRRKLNIAIALSHEARLLLLDEATSGLDPVVRDELLDVFLEFIQQEDRAIFHSSHILSDLEKTSDYIAFLHKGKLVFHEQKDMLTERYCVVKCSEEELARIDRSRIHGVKRNRFGIEALCERQAAAGFMQDPATIEDIMLFQIKEADIK